MPHPLRLYEPDRVYEVTSRIAQGRFLLRPSARVNDIIAGVIGHAQQLYPAVKLHGCVFLSNHATWLLSSSIPAQIPAFMGFVNGRISEEIGRVHDWPGRKWSRPARPIPAVDDESVIDRLRYLLAQGCKEQLVESPREWPGVTCVHALLGNAALRGHWYERDAQTRARRRGQPADDRLFATPHAVRFHKIPCWADLTDSEYAKRVSGIITDIEQRAATARRDQQSGVIGVQAILAQSPFHRPASIAHSPAPVCHAATRAARAAFRAAYRAFVDAYRAAAELLVTSMRRPKTASATQAKPITFPAGSFPPRLPFVDDSRPPFAFVPMSERITPAPEARGHEPKARWPAP